MGGVSLVAFQVLVNTNFNDQPLLFKLHSKKMHVEQEEIYGAYKPIVPVILEENTLKFDAWFRSRFMHNLSRYDAHYIVTELKYDNNWISAIPSTE